MSDDIGSVWIHTAMLQISHEILQGCDRSQSVWILIIRNQMDTRIDGNFTELNLQWVHMVVCTTSRSWFIMPILLVCKMAFYIKIKYWSGVYPSRPIFWNQDRYHTESKFLINCHDIHQKNYRKSGTISDDIGSVWIHRDMLQISHGILQGCDRFQGIWNLIIRNQTDSRPDRK